MSEYHKFIRATMEEDYIHGIQAMGTVMEMDSAVAIEAAMEVMEATEATEAMEEDLDDVDILNFIHP